MQGIMGVWALPLSEVRVPQWHDLSLNFKRKNGYDYRNKAGSLKDKAAMQSKLAIGVAAFILRESWQDEMEEEGKGVGAGWTVGDSRKNRVEKE